jgi:hypothetical protein
MASAKSSKVVQPSRTSLCFCGGQGPHYNGKEGDLPSLFTYQFLPYGGAEKIVLTQA